MPITQSAKKALRVSLRRKAENTRTKEALKKALRKVSTASLSQTFSVIDKAVKNDILHKNKAARLKSRLSKKFGKPESRKAGSEPKKSLKKKPTRLKHSKR